jgi:hypothetical protein
MLIVLCLANQKEAVMDTLYFYVRRMDATIEKSKETLNAAEERLNNLGFRMRMQHLNDKNSDDDDNSEGLLEDELDSVVKEEDNATATVTNNTDGKAVGLGLRVERRCKHCRAKLVSDFCIAGWMLSPIAYWR